MNNTQANNNKQLWHQPAWECVTERFSPVKTLGQGSHGTVIRAQNLKTGEHVAIKQIPNIYRSFDYCKRVLREIQVMKFLADHHKGQETFPFAVAKEFILYEPKQGEKQTEASIFIVMEEAHTTLFDILEQSDSVRLSQKEAIKIAYQLLVALRFLKSARILHRDIKPSNILVDQQFNIKITDFGLSRSYTTAKPRGPPVRRFSNHVISRWYRPPEVILLEKEYRETVDSWSAGCVIGELLTCTKDYLRAGSDKNCRWLFQGHSCFPLSPGEKDSEQEFELDQLKVIMDTLGVKSEDDLSFVKSKSAKKYLRGFASEVEIEKIEFSQEFELTDPRMSEVLHGLLEFDPSKRMDAKKLLLNSVFDKFRLPQLENLEPSHKLRLRLDKDDVFDYEKLEIGVLELNDLKGMMKNEIY